MGGYVVIPGQSVRSFAVRKAFFFSLTRGSECHSLPLGADVKIAPAKQLILFSVLVTSMTVKRPRTFIFLLGLTGPLKRYVLMVHPTAYHLQNPAVDIREY